MKKVLLLLTICLPFIAQAQGIKFEQGLTWEQIKAKAKAENKYIFMDCYTTWCGPCKFMSNTVFPQKEVGDYMNAKFINVSVQLDTTSNDDASVKLWRSDIPFLLKEYSIGAYPTLLFFSPDGEVLHRIVGTTGKEGRDFIAKVAEVFSPDKQYYYYLGNTKKHIGDSAFLHVALTKAIEAYDEDNISKIGSLYVDCLKYPLTKENLLLIEKITKTTKDHGFKILLDNVATVNDLVKPATSSTFLYESLSGMICHDYVDSIVQSKNESINYKSLQTRLMKRYPTLEKQISNQFELIFKQHVLKVIVFPMDYGYDGVFRDWNAIANKLNKKFNGYDFTQLLLEEQGRYYSRKKQWRLCERAACSLLNEFGTQLRPKDINNIVWEYIFLNCNDKKILRDALVWSKRAVELEPNEYGNLDTYANLLYKMGNLKSAIDYEKKAIASLESMPKGFDDRSLNEFKSNIVKMNKREKTWDDNFPVLSTQVKL